MRFRLTESVVTRPKFRAFITNLGKYSEGDLVGKWVDFPISEEDFNKVLKSIGIGDNNELGVPYEEWFVTDYECDLDAFDWHELGEYPSYEDLQNFGELVNSITDFDAVNGAFEVTGDLKEAIEGLDSGDIMFYRGIDTEQELAEYVISETGGVEELGRDTLEEFFDYEMLGRDLDFDTYENDDGDDISAGEYFCGNENATDEEIGEAFVDEVGFDGVGNIDSYFDFKEFGRQLLFDGYTFVPGGCIADYR